MADYTQALALCPNNSFALYNRGITKDRMADFAGEWQPLPGAAGVLSRTRAWRLVYTLFPRCAGCSRSRQLISPAPPPVPAPAGAVEDFTAAAALDPANADFYHNRGFSLRKQVGAAGGWAGRRLLASASSCKGSSASLRPPPCR